MMELNKALVVDDSRSARFSLRKTLEKLGVHVDCVDCGETALSYLSESEPQLPDIIFMDNLMPGMDGYETARNIQDKGQWTHIPIVMCSATETIDSLPKVIENGMIGILPKPASVNDINSLIGSLNDNQESTNDSNLKLVEDRSPTISNEWLKLKLELQEHFNQKLAGLKTDLHALIEDKLNQNDTGSIQTSSAQTQSAELEHTLNSRMIDQLLSADKIEAVIMPFIQNEMSLFKKHIQAELQNKELNEARLLEKSEQKSSFVATHQAVETSQRVAKETAQHIIQAGLHKQTEQTQKAIQQHNDKQLKRSLRAHRIMSASSLAAALISLVFIISQYVQ